MTANSLPSLKIMPKTHNDKRRKGKDKRRNTFNKYGKNTARGLRHMMAQQQAQKKNQIGKNQKKVTKK